MPIYQYRCEACDERFEELQRASAEPPPCPRCQARKAVRVYSTFGTAPVRNGKFSRSGVVSISGSFTSKKKAKGRIVGAEQYLRAASPTMVCDSA